MARTPFTPSPEQTKTLQDLARLAARRAADDAKLTELIRLADTQGVPRRKIAEVAEVEPKTVYRRLGFKMA